MTVFLVDFPVAEEYVARGAHRKPEHQGTDTPQRS